MRNIFTIVALALLLTSILLTNAVCLIEIEAQAAATPERNNTWVASFVEYVEEQMETATLYASEAHANPNMSKSYTLSGAGELIEAESYDVDGDILAPSGSLKASIKEMTFYISTVSPFSSIPMPQANH